MKFFHLSDLHIGLKLYNRDLGEDQAYILRQIIRLAAEERPDALVIAGDIYDRAVPPAEAVELFDRFITELTDTLPKLSVMLIAGNHDSGPRVGCLNAILSRQNVHMIGQPPRTKEEYMEKVVLRDQYGPVNFYLLPFVRPSMARRAVGDEEERALSYEETLRRLIARETLDPAQRNVIVSHQFYLPSGSRPEDIERMDSEIPTVGNIDAVPADILESFDYGALGHIHKPMKAGGEFCRYCGTPLACSVSEAGQEKSIVQVELGEKGDRKVRLLPLKPLRQVKIIRGEFSQVLGQACQDYVTVILTDREDLDVLDMQDKLRSAFPYLLEIRREGIRRADYTNRRAAAKEPDPFELCCSFLGDTDEEEREILRDVINSLQEVTEK